MSNNAKELKWGSMFLWLISLLCIDTDAYAEKHVKHVIMNKDVLIFNYEFSGACFATGTLKPGQTKQIDCPSHGTYVLRAQLDDWFNPRENCRTYAVTKDAQVNWTLALNVQPEHEVVGITVEEKPF